MAATRKPAVGPEWTCGAAPWSLCPAAGWPGPGPGRNTECKQMRPRPPSSSLALRPAAERPGLVVSALRRAWRGQLIFLVSILGCDNTKHPLGLAGHCMGKPVFLEVGEDGLSPRLRGSTGSRAQSSPPGSLGSITGIWRGRIESFCPSPCP